MPYFDHAGAGQMSSEQKKALMDLLSHLQLANPHSQHYSSRITRNIVENARLRVLEHFNASKDYHVIFTYNTTHSLKILSESFEFGPKITGECKIMGTSETPLLRGPSLGFQLDSHNSVVGTREICRNRVDNIICVNSFDDIPTVKCNSLFILTAMSNFCGRKYDLKVVEEIRDKGWSVCLDSASLVSCSFLNISKYRPDFVVLSFYKIFGYPTGLGALIVHKDSSNLLGKRYFSGGTIATIVPRSFSVRQKNRFEERFEDGTMNFYAIAALQIGFEDIQRFGGISVIEKKTTELALAATQMLQSKIHWNAAPVVQIYRTTSAVYGNIVAFNLLRDDGSYVGFGEVAKMADLFGIELRVGCFCNTGACQIHLGLKDEMLQKYGEYGKECGDDMDVLNGRPLGAVRISFGRTNTHKDIDCLEQMIDVCFLGEHRAIEITPILPLTNYTSSISKLLCYPVKSCRGITVESADLCPSGFTIDRQFSISANDAVLSQKSTPQLSVIDTEITGSSTLILRNSKENLECEVGFQQTSGTHAIGTVVCTHKVETHDCGEEVAKFLSKTLQIANCRLRSVNPDCTRSLANEACFLLVNQASVKIMSDQIGLTLDETILRFRPNIVITGLPPFTEDSIENLTIDGIQFKVVGKCTRCEMICVDSKTAKRSADLIVALRNFRNGCKMTFGIYIQEVGDSRKALHVGDSICFCDFQ